METHQLVDNLINMRPGHYRQGLIDMMEKINASDLVFAEVGCYRGEGTEIILGTGKIKKMYCIDPWKSFYDDGDDASFTDMEKVMADFDSRILSNYPNVEKIRGTLSDFVKLPHDKIDVVYIDACHTYDACIDDIKKAVACLDPAVAIAGHDYHPVYGVFKAVNEYFGKPDMIFCDTSWLVLRKDENQPYGIIKYDNNY
jgi:hypothetical protein